MLLIGGREFSRRVGDFRRARGGGFLGFFLFFLRFVLRIFLFFGPRQVQIRLNGASVAVVRLQWVRQESCRVNV